MSKASASRMAVLALLTLGASSGAWGDTQRRTRVTIRGTGANVAIERTEAPVPKRRFETNAFPAGPIGEATRLKESGADDVAVIGYLRAHQAEIPPIIDAGDVSLLRRAGAGKSVVTYLATVAAVDIGETGEGYETVVSNAPAPQPGLEPSPYGVSYGYPLASGYLAPYPQRFGARGAIPSRRLVRRPGHPVLRGVFSSHAAPARHRMVE